MKSLIKRRVLLIIIVFLATFFLTSCIVKTRPVTLVKSAEPTGKCKYCNGLGLKGNSECKKCEGTGES